MGSGFRHRSRNEQTFLEIVMARLDRMDGFVAELHWSVIGYWRQGESGNMPVETPILMRLSI